MCNTHQTVIRCFIAVVFSLILPFSVSAQEVIDSVQYRAVYDFSYKTNPDQTEFAKADLMYLDIGPKTTKFYSRFEEIRDSIKYDALEKKLSASEINNARKGYDKGTSTIYIQYFNKQQTRTINTYFSFGFMYDEPTTIIKWQITNTESFEILDFRYKRAEAICFGRKWIVYFTPEIPLNNGPFKLWGLPGLIIKAWDKDNYFTYELKGFKQLTATNPIILRKSNYSGKLYSLLNKKQYIEYESLYHENGVQFVEFIQGTTFTTNDGMSLSSLIKKVSYIPLEPW